MRTFALFLLSGLALSAAPDCNQSYRWSNRPTDQADGISTFTTNGGTAVPAPAINNKATGCTAWIMIVDVEGFSADSIVLQSAPNAGPSAAGTFITFAGSTTSGSNPTTTTASSTYLATGYYPWLRVNVTTVTGAPGSINVQLFGWRSQAFLTASTGSGGVADGTTICGTSTFSICANGVGFSQLATTTLQTVTVAVSSAQWLGSHATPVQLLAAQGAGTLIYVDSVVLNLIYGGTQYTGGTNTTIGIGTSGSATSWAGIAITSTNVDGTTANTAFSDVGMLYSSATSGLLNTGVFLTSSVAYLTGNSTFSIILFYRVISGLS